MKYNLRLFSVLGFFLTVLLLPIMPLNAQNRPTTGRSGQGEVPGHGRGSLLININARVLDGDGTIAWEQTENKITIPGRPVGINMVGANIVVAVQFTPFIRRGSSVLVAQGQIWIQDPERGISYYTSIQTIPLELGEPILFFPLGSSEQPNSSIEIIITVNPHNSNEN